MYKCVVFDLDGTIADTIDTITYFANFALEKFGLPIIEKDRYKYLVGDGYKVLIKRMLKEVGQENYGSYEELAGFYHDEYDKNSMYLTKAFEGMHKLISELKEKNIKLAVLSNKPEGAVKMVASKLYGDVFDLCFGYKEGVVLKPDPTLLFEIIEKLGCSPEECVYVGDTDTDMKTGKNAGAFTVGVLWGFRREDELLKTGADFIAKTPSDILKLIESE